MSCASLFKRRFSISGNAFKSSVSHGRSLLECHLIISIEKMIPLVVRPKTWMLDNRDIAVLHHELNRHAHKEF